jgi:hypothetical protein
LKIGLKAVAYLWLQREGSKETPFSKEKTQLVHSWPWLFILPLPSWEEISFSGYLDIFCLLLHPKLSGALLSSINRFPCSAVSAGFSKWGVLTGGT